MGKKANGQMKVISINISKYTLNTIKHLVKTGAYNSCSETIRVYINEGFKRDAFLYNLIKLPEIAESFKELMAMNREKEALEEYKKRYATSIIDGDGKEWQVQK